jgi:hypothetical protein
MEPMMAAVDNGTSLVNVSGGNGGLLQSVLWYSGHVYKGSVQRSVHARYIDTNVSAKW